MGITWLNGPFCGAMIQFSKSGSQDLSNDTDLVSLPPFFFLSTSTFYGTCDVAHSVEQPIELSALSSIFFPRRRTASEETHR